MLAANPCCELLPGVRLHGSIFPCKNNEDSERPRSRFLHLHSHPWPLAIDIQQCIKIIQIPFLLELDGVQTAKAKLHMAWCGIHGCLVLGLQKSRQVFLGKSRI